MIGFKKKSELRPGPDIIHSGILILIAGSIISFFGRIEDTYYLTQGEKLNILKKYDLVLDDFIYEKYADGNPKNYSSKISLLVNGKLSGEKYIEVNHPLIIEKYAIYQQSFSQLQGIILADNSGKINIVKQDHVLKNQSDLIYFVKYENENAFFVVKHADDSIEKKKIKIGERIGSQILKNFTAQYQSGLKIVYDPGITFVIISFIVICSGLAVTVIRKLKDLKDD